MAQKKNHRRSPRGPDVVANCNRHVALMRQQRAVGERLLIQRLASSSSPSWRRRSLRESKRRRVRRSFGPFRGTLNLKAAETFPAAAAVLTMALWHKMLAPARRMWFGVAKLVGIRKTGLVKLRNDVRTCEYEDVHVLWEMLESNGSQLAIARTKRRPFWNIGYWARHASYFCHRF